MDVWRGGGNDTLDDMSAMELLTTPTADDWDGNIVISDMEEPNREEGG